MLHDQITERPQPARREASAPWGGSGRVIRGGRDPQVDADVVETTGNSGRIPVVGGRPQVATGSNQRTDEQLVRLYQSGEDREGSLLELFERYGQLTYAFLRRRIGDAEIAAELNQDLYIGVMESLDRFRGESSFKTWLFRLAHHRLSNQRRRWRTHLDETPDATPDELMEVLASDAIQPDEQFDKDEATRALEKCLAALPEVQRAVIVGQYYEQITLEELTKNLNLTNKSGARASLIAAQRKLRRCMEQNGIIADV